MTKFALRIITASSVISALVGVTSQAHALNGPPPDPVSIDQSTVFTPAVIRSNFAHIINLRGSLSTPGGILSNLLPFLFAFGGIILFVMLVWGGFEILFGAAEPKSQEAGKQRITAALLGFLLLFASFWIAQIAEVIFGINILHN